MSRLPPEKAANSQLYSSASLPGACVPTEVSTTSGSLSPVEPGPERSALTALPYSQFGRFFKRSQFAARFDADGLTLTSLHQNRLYRTSTQSEADTMRLSGSESELSFSWKQLDKPVLFNWSFFGYLMSFTVDERSYCTPFLTYASKRCFNNAMAEHWARANQSTLCGLIGKIEEAISTRYLRTSRVKLIKARVAREYRRWFPWSRNDSLVLGEEVKTALKSLHRFNRWTSEDIELIRDQYISQQLIEHKGFFDSVESNPLTDKQRRACIIDDNNNLLLAGAGTGKTSVMVGRAGYLIKSGQANATDILLLAFGKKAAQELDERIRLKLGSLLTAQQGETPDSAVKASTFHSLAMRIIYDVEGVKPRLSPWIDDKDARVCWINRALESQLKDKRYRKRLINYFDKHYYPAHSAFYFKNESDHNDYIRVHELRPLHGERVNNYFHLKIADWLFRHGIEYRYGSAYPHTGGEKESGRYRSDFYLPQYDIYIDYFDIDESGSTPVFIDDDTYRASVAYRKQLHQQNDTHYIELYYHQHQHGQLLKSLSKALVKKRVKRTPVDDEVLLAKLREQGYLANLVSLFNQAISLYKGACLDSKTLTERLSDSAHQEETDAVFKLLKPIIKAYQEHLSTSGEIDFEDMIAKAIDYIQTGKFISPWRYIMVDEFQDISEPRARLVKALRDSASGALKGASAAVKPADNSNVQTVKRGTHVSLFCVGDDWQAIYRFNGADVKLTTEFERYFGTVTKTHLDLTFRFNSRIGDVASQFVMQNPMQLDKSIRSINKGSKSSVSIVKVPKPGRLEQSLFSPLLDSIEGLLAKRKDNADKKSSVYILARYWYLLPDMQELADLRLRYPALNIECHSFHGAKGKEADYVFVMGLTAGAHGFPSSRTTAPILEALLPEEDDFKFAEERRLFYVALTRAKHKVYLLTDAKAMSPFVREITQY
ncbi:UvrD-helicase domain-containing protein [Shewanella atlantica]|uniref:UvrD-helicase domain-containing protein n=1 Tax=Shewanella atlantica TaxID=271099 RepID=UPI003735FD71